MAELATLVHLAHRRVRWALGDRSPLVASLKLTARCNLSCVQCPWVGGAAPELSTSAWSDRIVELGRRGVRYLVLEGGEPTLRADLGALIEAGRAQAMKVTVATNGLRPLTGLHPDRFLVSVDGLPATHDQLRGERAFERMHANLSSAEAPVVALVSLWRGNQEELPELLDLLADRVDAFWFSFLYDYAGHETLALEPAARAAVAATAARLARIHRVVNTRGFLAGAGRRRACRPWLLTTVTADGRERRGCVVGAVESHDCARCDLACHRELSDLMAPEHWFDQLRTHLRKSWA